MPIEWPSTLPNPTLGGFQHGRQNARQERTGETGPPRFRRKFTAVAEPVSMSMVLDTSQLWQLETFYIDTTQEGSLPFLMPDYLRDGKPIANEHGALLLDGGLPLLLSVKKLCVFNDFLPKSPVSNSRSRVSFSLWYLP